MLIAFREDMAIALVFNPGSNSLKFELIELADDQRVASQAKKLASAALDGIGKETKLSVYDGRNVVSEQDAEAKDMTAGVGAALGWLKEQKDLAGKLQQLTFAGVRVVHGGSKYAGAIRATPEVRKDILALQELAPLDNQSSLEILDVLAEDLPDTPAYVTFDTAFHRTLPEKAWRYPIERETADRHGVRKFGFHFFDKGYMVL